MKIISLQKLTNRERKALADTYNKNFPLSLWSEKYFLSFLIDTARLSIGFCVRDKNVTIGFVLGRLISEKSFIFCLSTLWVDKQFRGQGLGEKLVQKIIGAVSKKIAIQKMILHFRDANDLKNYYARLGFSSYKTLGAYSNGDLKHQMELKIKQKI